jgi:hypothetical protein
MIGRCQGAFFASVGRWGWSGPPGPLTFSSAHGVYPTYRQTIHHNPIRLMGAPPYLDPGSVFRPTSLEFNRPFSMRESPTDNGRRHRPIPDNPPRLSRPRGEWGTEKGSNIGDPDRERKASPLRYNCGDTALGLPEYPRSRWQTGEGQFLPPEGTFGASRGKPQPWP